MYFVLRLLRTFFILFFGLWIADCHWHDTCYWARIWRTWAMWNLINTSKSLFGSALQHLGFCQAPRRGVGYYPRWVLKSTVWIGTLDLERRCPHLGFSCSRWCHQTEVISRNSKPCGEAIADASKGGSGGVESTNYSDPQFAEFVYNSIHCWVFGCLWWTDCSYRRKFRSQTSDNMDRWKAEQGRGREKRKIRREKSRRERVRRKKMEMAKR